jgi:glycosyltransferase involved in cell wall biosynthesis
MRVLITATSLRASYGGPAFSVSHLAAALGAHGIEVGLWAADGFAPEPELLAADAPVRRITGSPQAAIETFTPDLIHDNGLWLPHNHRLGELARGAGLPRIVSTRGMLEPWAIRHKPLKKKLAWRLYQRRDLDRASALHATAEPEAEHLAAFSLAAPATMIPNGVDLPELKESVPISRDPTRTALFLGRIYPVKGLPMLIEAWARVRPPGWRLVIAGPDEAGHQRTVETAVAAAGLGEAVSFTGPVAGEAKAALLRDADLFILPSHSESFGMVVGEALAHGTPVLTTTAVPWLALEERGCGWRAAPTPEALATSLRQAIACDRETLRRMGAAGRAFVGETLGWRGVADRFIALYDDVAGRPAAAPRRTAA